MELFLKGLFGAIITILLTLIARSGLSFLAGLIPLFPTFAIMAQVITHDAGGLVSLKGALWFGLLSIIPYSAYLISMLLLVDKHSITISISILISLIFWVLASFFIYFIWNYFDLKNLLI